MRTAESKGKYSIGTHFDLKQFAPKGWLTGTEWNWGPYYASVVESVRSNTWKARTDTYGMKAGYVGLASFGTAVPKAVQDKAVGLVQKIKQDKVNVFQGPLKDRNGKERLAAGKTGDAAWLAGMDWFVPGIEGSPPKN